MAIPAVATHTPTTSNPGPALMRGSYVLRQQHGPRLDMRAADAMGRRAPERVATFLLQISRNNRYEGRDPNALPDSLSCGFVADLLGLDVPALADILVAFERRGLVEHMAGGGLRLSNPTGLETLANLN